MSTSSRRSSSSPGKGGGSSFSPARKPFSPWRDSWVQAISSGKTSSDSSTNRFFRCFTRGKPDPRSLRRPWSSGWPGPSKGVFSFEQQRERLNEFKDREIYLIDLEHILQPEVDFRAFAERLTVLAEKVVQTATERVYQHLSSRFGVPTTIGGLEARLAVMGLGKLGGAALGYASDIELLFVYSDSGRTNGADSHRKRGVLRPPGQRGHRLHQGKTGRHLSCRCPASSVRERRSPGEQPGDLLQLLRTGGTGPFLRAAGPRPDACRRREIGDSAKGSRG